MMLNLITYQGTHPWGATWDPSDWQKSSLLTPDVSENKEKWDFGSISGGCLNHTVGIRELLHKS